MPNDTVELRYNDQHHYLCVKEAAFFAGRDSTEQFELKLVEITFLDHSCMHIIFTSLILENV